MKLRYSFVLAAIAVFALVGMSAIAAEEGLLNSLGLRIGYENNQNPDNDMGEAPVVTFTYTHDIEAWRLWGRLGYGAEWELFAKSLIEFEVGGGKKINYFTLGGGLKILHFSQDEKFIVDYTIICPELVARGEFPFGETGLTGILDLTLYPAAFFTRGEGYSVSKAAYGDAETGITYGYKGEASLKWYIAQFAVEAGIRYMTIDRASLSAFYGGDQFLGPFIEGSWRF